MIPGTDLRFIRSLDPSSEGKPAESLAIVSKAGDPSEALLIRVPLTPVDSTYLVEEKGGAFGFVRDPRDATRFPARRAARIVRYLNSRSHRSVMVEGRECSAVTPKEAAL